MVSTPSAPAGRTAPTFSGRGGGGIDQQLVALMIKNVEDKLDSRLNAVETDIATKLRSVPGYWTIWGAAATTVVSLAGLIFAIMSIAGDRFDSGIGYGMSVGDRFSQAERANEENRRRDSEMQKILQSLALDIGKIAEKIGNEGHK